MSSCAMADVKNHLFRFLGSLYFSTCFAEHIPEEVDLVLIELGKLTLLLSVFPALIVSGFLAL